MPMHKKLCRRDVQLLADVFADLHQRAAARATGAAGRLVAVLDARQLLGQRLPASPFVRGAQRRHM